MKKRIYKNNTPFDNSLTYTNIRTEDCLGLSAESVGIHINTNGPDVSMIIDVNYTKAGLKVKERVEITPRRLKGLIMVGRAIERTTLENIRMINFSRRDCKFIKYL